MRRVVSLCAVLAATPVHAGDLAVSVLTTAGQPVKDAVVTVHPAGGAGAAPGRFPWPLRMDQRDMQFEPFVLIVPVGGEVAFPNRDAVRHHVYSFSPAKRFELKLYGRDDSRSVRFDKPGTVAIGCNIHDGMVAFIRVVDTRHAAKSGADGRAVVSGLPAGPAVVKVWHPHLKAPDNTLARSVGVPSTGVAQQRFAAPLRVPPKRQHAY